MLLDRRRSSFHLCSCANEATLLKSATHYSGLRVRPWTANSPRRSGSTPLWRVTRRFDDRLVAYRWSCFRKRNRLSAAYLDAPETKKENNFMEFHNIFRRVPMHATAVVVRISKTICAVHHAD